MGTLQTVEVIDEHIKNRQHLKSERYKAMYDIAERFIISKKLLAYGGIAINAMMPPSKKIYSNNDIPDYDVYSPLAKEHALALADEYAKHKYEYIEVRPGLHSGTYKVYVEFQPVMDITQMAPKTFTHLQSMAAFRTFPTVPIEFLLMSVHLELSRPLGHIERWKKIYPRLQALYEVYSPKKANVPSPIISMDSGVKKRILRIAERFPSPVLVTGIEAADPSLPTPYLEFLAEDPHALARAIDPAGTVKDLTGNDIMPEGVLLKANGHTCIIYKLTSCVSYTTRGRLKVASFDAILHHLYSVLLSPHRLQSKPLTRIAINHLLALKPAATVRFPTECVGTQETIENVKKDRWDRKRPLSVYRPKKFLSNKA